MIFIIGQEGMGYYSDYCRVFGIEYAGFSKVWEYDQQFAARKVNLRSQLNGKSSVLKLEASFCRKRRILFEKLAEKTIDFHS